MKITVLGSGTCVPSLIRNAPGYILETAGASILLDCGNGTIIQLKRAEKSLADLDAVFVTHRHPDHFSDLMPLIHTLVAAPGLRREKDLHVIGPALFIEYYETAFRPVLFAGKEFDIIADEARDRFDFGPFIVSTARTIHSEDSIAYRFDHDEKSVVYTGDTDYAPEVVELARGADLLIADCSFPARMKARNHMTAEECGIMAREAGVKQLVLSHLYPADRPEEERVDEAAAAFDGEIILAEDLMEIEV